MASKTKNAKSLEHGLTILGSFINDNFGNGGYPWAILTEGEKLQVHERTSQPCYGEMRPYAIINHYNGGEPEPELLPVSQRQVDKPSDLFSPFPKEKPIAVAVPFTGHNNELFLLSLFDKENSPWRKVLNGVELVKNGDGVIIGAIIHDTKVDPTIMVNLFRIVKRYDCFDKTIYNRTQGLDEKDRIILSLICSIGAKFLHISNGPFGVTPDFHRVYTGNPVDYSDGGTFYERYAYNRPMQDYIWGNSPSIRTEFGKKVNIHGMFAAFNEVHFDKFVEFYLDWRSISREK